MNQKPLDELRKELREDFQFRLKLHQEIFELKHRVDALEEAGKPKEPASINTKVKVANTEGKWKFWITVILVAGNIIVAAIAILK